MWLVKTCRDLLLVMLLVISGSLVSDVVLVTVI